mgnify:CR=1
MYRTRDTNTIKIGQVKKAGIKNTTCLRDALINSSFGRKIIDIIAIPIVGYAYPIKSSRATEGIFMGTLAADLIGTFVSMFSKKLIKYISIVVAVLTIISMVAFLLIPLLGY